MAREKAPICPTAEIVLPMQSYVVRTSITPFWSIRASETTRTAPIVRAGIRRPTTPMSNLAAVGLTPEDIDFVMCTHLHHDHVGWNTKLVDGRLVPTFPNAKYLMSKKNLMFSSRRKGGVALAD